MILRRLSPADAAVFRTLRLAALRDAPTAFGVSHDEECDQPLDAVAARLQPAAGRAVFGAFDGEALVGLAGLAREPVAKAAHKAFLWGVYVVPPARGQGVARCLVEAALAFARATPGLAKVTLEVDAANAHAIALYASLGFTVFGHERDAMRVDGEPRDDFKMALVL